MDQLPDTPASSPAAAPLYKDRRGWLIAFGIVELLIACFLLLMAVMMAVVIPGMPKTSGQPDLPGAFFYAVSAFYLVFVAFFAAAGIGSIRARNWARLAMIGASSVWLAFGVLGTIITVAIMPTILKQQQAVIQQASIQQNQAAQLPPNFLSIILVISTVFQVSIMILLPLTLLLFYSSKNVKATCMARSMLPGLVRPSHDVLQAYTSKRLPVPILILAVWFSISGLSMLLILPWFPLTTVFGFFVRGWPARLIFLAFATASGYCAWSFCKLRVEGWWIAVFSWIFWFLSGAVSVIKLGLSGIYGQAYQQMGIDPQQMAIHIFGPDSIKVLWGIGLLISCAFFALILYTKRYFRPPQQTAE
jgi:hypothetical protein